MHKHWLVVATIALVASGGMALAETAADPTAGLGAVGGYAALSNYTALGGSLTVFALPQ